MTLTVSAARRRWGGRRVPFAPAAPPGGPRHLPLRSALSARGGRQGVRGMCPRCQCGLCPPALVVVCDRGLSVGLCRLVCLAWAGRAQPAEREHRECDHGVG